MTIFQKPFKSSLVLFLVLLFPTLSPSVMAETAGKHEGIQVTVNINTATAEELSTLLVGIGEKKAQDIIKYREENGPFSTAEQLAEVKGIGPSTLKKNEGRVLL